jgi:hypothetical protein
MSHTKIGCTETKCVGTGVYLRRKLEDKLSCIPCITESLESQNTSECLYCNAARRIRYMSEKIPFPSLRKYMLLDSFSPSVLVRGGLKGRWVNAKMNCVRTRGWDP